MEPTWKPNWNQTREHFVDWWDHTGTVIGTWSPFPRSSPIERMPDPGPWPSIEHYHTHPEYRALSNHWALSHSSFPGDILPLSNTMTGPGSLAMYLGSEPGFSPQTIWYKPCIDHTNPESHKEIRFDPSNRWWQIAEQTLRECVARSRGKYLVGFPDLIENIDILAAMRDPQALLFDMIERPEWVEQKVREINRAYFEVYQRMYDIIKQPDNSSAFHAFSLWGPGKVAKVQCDACAMFSTEMFARFVAPCLREQCEWLDYSMYHLDGHQCIQHLDVLLGIEALDAIEWTPDPQVPGGGDPCWYPMYRRILDAGKSVQAIGMSVDEVEPLLDACGGAGMYLLMYARDESEFERACEIAERYRVGSTA